MHRAAVLFRVLTIAPLSSTRVMAQARSPGALGIYVIDVDGGNATLFVPPSRESLLIDTGNAGAAAARDAGRIMEAIEDAKLQQIDHLITTLARRSFRRHGGTCLQDLAVNLFDHGSNVQPGEAANTFLQLLSFLGPQAPTRTPRNRAGRRHALVTCPRAPRRARSRNTSR
jgi:hypothetical protein